MVKIGGVIKNSLIDYPGKISYVVFFQGCNMKPYCPYCSNPDLLSKNPLFKKYVPEEEVVTYLKKYKKMLDAVVLLGGEALLQPDLEEFCKKVKDIGLLVKLDTNGLLPDKMINLIEKGLIDYVAMDIKTNLFLNEEYRKSRDYLLREFPNNFEFRLTCVPTLVTDLNIHTILHYFAGAKKVYLQNFSNKSVLDKKLKNVEPYLISKLEEWAKKYSHLFGELSVR